MYINKVYVRNFRVLSKSELDFKDNLCLMIGRNNSGKTSLLVLFEKFLNSLSFDYNDFSICKRSMLLDINTNSIVTDFSIQLILNIEYEEKDDLCRLSEFIMDLDPERLDVNILFECSINKRKLLEGIDLAHDMPKEKFIKKYLSNYLEKNIYIFNDLSDLKFENRYRLIKKESEEVRALIDFEIIHAKRSVSSSEEKNGKKILSNLATNYFNNTNINSPDKFESINKLIAEMDIKLGEKYDKFFAGFLSNTKEFLGLDGLNIISNLKANEILEDSSEVIYGDDTSQLPEYLNGLGHMNILYLLLNIEIKKNSFLASNKDIKLLFIEEPEAHTHPQLQYIFARKISSILSELTSVQTIITTHSPHIVANHPFENIRYMLVGEDTCGFKNIEIKNFYKDLSSKYETEEEEFQFLKQYLTIESAELFFADKAIFIEGISENMLMPYFISKYDEIQIQKENELMRSPGKKEKYVPIASQNVSMLQVGANAKAFRHFLEFLKIRTLIITDIDTTKYNDNKKFVACAVNNVPSNTSNQTIKYYLSAPEISEKLSFENWLNDLVDHNLSTISEYVRLAYQKNEGSYHPRSFEDAFINKNLDKMKEKCEKINGLKNIEEFKCNGDIYDLTRKVIDKKSDFASSILFTAHVDQTNWESPSYIWEGLKWIQKL